MEKVQRRFLLLVAVVILPAAEARGTSINDEPRPVRILAGGERFLAQNTMESVALYSAEGLCLHTFPCEGIPSELDVTPDETGLLLASYAGEVSRWSLDTGELAWCLDPSDSDLDFVDDLSLSADGRRCVVTSSEGFALVLDAATGEHVARVGFKIPMMIMSAALAPDGKTGVLISLDERIFVFEVATGVVRYTGRRGGWPIRYSADGRYVACRSSNSEWREQLRVIKVKTWQARDVGRFSHIGHIRPLPTGDFHVTARVDERGEDIWHVVGLRHTPGEGEPVELWRRPAWQGCGVRTDFGIDPLRGVSTEFTLVTHLTDLRTGRTIREIDNMAHLRLPSGPHGWWWWIGHGLAVVVVVASLIWALRWIGRAIARSW